MLLTYFTINYEDMRTLTEARRIEINHPDHRVYTPWNYKIYSTQGDRSNFHVILAFIYLIIFLYNTLHLLIIFYYSTDVNHLQIIQINHKILSMSKLYF